MGATFRGLPMRLRILDARIAGTQPLQKVPFWDGLVMASFIDQPPCADWIWPPSAPQKEIHVNFTRTVYY